MKKESLIFSSVVSIVLAGLSVIPAFPAAEDNADSFSSSQTDDSRSLYDTTNDDKSKDEPEITDIEKDSSDKTTDSETPFNVFDIYNAYVASVEPPDIHLMSKGIDVSQWQGNIDWQAVKDSGIDFAIIRAGYGKLVSQKDPTFDYNVQNAQRVGLNCGTYWYSYALTVEDAQAEAEACYEIIKNYDFNYPVYFDIEDPSQSGLSAAQVSAIIETFCTTLQEKGCYVGLYSYANFLTTHVFETVLKKYDVWVAHFDVMQPDFNGEYGMWQYSSTGAVNGINGNVDMDYSYINYPYLISPETYTPPTATTAPQSTLTTTTVTTTASVDNGIIAKGMNVSAFQGDVDWQAVKDGGIDYAIIRAGYGKFASQKDEKFEQNILGAKSAGIDCGAYWYSYAVTVEEALQEAELFYETIKDYQFEYPVYFNIEDPIFSDLSKEEITAITDAFCSFMESKGYYVGIMSYVNFLNNKLDASIFDKYDVSAAHYGVKAPDFLRFFGLWNYPNTGSANGVEGNVYLSNCYEDYPLIMTSKHLNGF